MHFSSSVFLQFIGHEITHSKGRKKDGGSLDGGVSQLGMGSASYYGEFHGQYKHKQVKHFYVDLFSSHFPFHQISGEKGPALTPSGLGIESISEFRRQIINKKSGGGLKKLNGLKQKGTANGMNSNSVVTEGGSVVSGDQSKFELVHEPSDTASFGGGSQVRFAS